MIAYSSLTPSSVVARLSQQPVTQQPVARCPYVAACGSDETGWPAAGWSPPPLAEPLASVASVSLPRHGVTIETEAGRHSRPCAGDAGRLGGDWSRMIGGPIEQTPSPRHAGQGKGVVATTPNPSLMDPEQEESYRMTYLRRHRTVQAALSVAERLSEAYGDNYLIIDTGSGYAAVMEGDLSCYGGRGWRVVSHHRPNKNHNLRPKRKVFDNTLYNATSQDVLNEEATHA